MKCPKCEFENPDTVKFCSECGTQFGISEEAQPSFTKTLETPSPGLKPGTLFADRYEIMGELGIGGMGRVYKVLDTQINEEMALKLLKPEIVANAEMIDRFRNELKIARKISHKNICRMHDINEVDGTPFITMEYVAGEDLKSLIRRKERLAEEEVLSIAQQVCEGLAEAHDLGVIHRDLKPQNIMIDKNGRAKIMDFGIARSVEAPGMTQTGMIIGTPDYLSPEQAEGQEVDHRSDIYSLGVILYEMVTGSVPFSGDTALAVVLKHKSQYPLHPQKLNPDLSDDLSRLILICMEKERDRRYQSAGELLNDLRNIEEGLPLGAKIRPRRETFIATLARKKLFIPVMVGALAILAVAILRFLPQRTLMPAEFLGKPSIAIMHFKNYTGDSNYDYLKSGLSRSVIIDLSQSKFVRVLGADRLNSILRKWDLLDTQGYTTEDLEKVADEGRVNHILEGSLSKAGDIFRIEYTLHNIAMGEIVGTHRAQGEGIESLFAMVDELTEKMKSDLGLSEETIASDIDESFGNISTNSPEALKYYLEGRRLHVELKFAESIEMMEKAIKIDPEFAMAYRSIFVSSQNKAVEYLQKAFELSQGERVSLRERLQIQGQYYHTAAGGRDRGKAYEIFQNLLDLYPDDFIGNQFLGLIYMSWEQWGNAVLHFKIRVNLGDETYYSHLWAAWVLTAIGDYGQAEEILRNYLDNYSDFVHMRLALAKVYVLLGKYENAMGEIENAQALDPMDPEPVVEKSNILILKGEWDRAEAVCQELLAREDLVPNPGIGLQAHIYLLQGRFRELLDLTKDSNLLAIQGYTNLITKNWEESLKYFKKASMVDGQAAVYIEMGALEKAQEAVNRIEELHNKFMLKKTHAFYLKYFYALSGRLELKKGNYPEAIEFLKKGLSRCPSEHIISIFRHDRVLFFKDLAQAYYKSGSLKSAVETYKKITELTIGRLELGDIYVRAFYNLGKIYEEQGDRAKAVENYAKFLDLWKDADPGIVEVEDAKKRLADLD